jgi:integrase
MVESRRVPIPPTLVRILRDYTAARRATGKVFRAAARAAADGSTPAPQAPTLSNWRRALGRVLPGTSIYDLRHLHATVLVREIPLGEAADRLGHSVETLTSTYIQVLQGDEEEANAALDRVFGDM